MRKAHLLAATALLAITAAQTARAGSLTAFGDSLSDNGNLYALIHYPPSPPYYQGHFSNGDVWVQYLPGLTGLSFTPGNDYAYGGAFTGNLTINGVNYGTSLVAPSFPGVTTEIATFTAQGGHFGTSDVVTLWAGANNYFEYLNVALANPGTGAALVASGVPTTITQLTADAHALISLGAQTLIVPNIPNLGVTPSYNTNAANAALANSFSTLHDQELPGAMAALHNATGANIIVLNTQQLLTNVIANPAFYGFSNVTDECLTTPSCVSASQATQDTYLFWDDVHPTTHAQYIIAEYAAQSLRGFQSLSVPARLGNSDAQSFTTLLTNRMEALRAAGTGYTYNIAANGMTPAAEPDTSHKLSVYITSSGNFGGWNNSGNNLGYTGSSTGVALGADYALQPNIHLGLALGTVIGNANVNGGGTVHDNTFSLGLYALATEGQFYAEGTFSHSNNWYRIQHPAVFGGNIEGNPSGGSFGTSAFGGYVFPLCPGLTLTPSAGLLLTNASLQSYAETGDPLLTQSVNDQGYTQLLGQTGVEAATSTLLGNTRLATYASAAMQARLSGDNGNFTSAFSDMPGVPLTTTYPNEPVAWALLSAGVSAAITNQLSASAAVQSTAFKATGNDVSVNASLSWLF
jgi:outer membrane lipase/esterase